MDIGAFLKLTRQEKDLTQKEVADAVGVSEGTVSRWESGKIGNMRRDKIEALAKVLDIDPTIITRGKYAAVLESVDGPIKRLDTIPSLPRPYKTPISRVNLSPTTITGMLSAHAEAAKTAKITDSAAKDTLSVAKAVEAAIVGTAKPVSPVAEALASLANAAEALHKLIEVSPNVDAVQATAEFNEDERQLIADYRTLSDSDKQTIQIMIRLLKEKNTSASSDAMHEEG